MEKTQTSQNGTSTSKRVEGKSEAEYIRPIRTKSGLDLPIHELEAKELMAMYPQWSKEIAEAAEINYEGGLETSSFNEMQEYKRMQSTSSKEENW
jgi:hypothetical protein